MSQPTDDEDDRLELHVLADPKHSVERDIVEILTAVAHFHRTGSHLGLEHSVNFGKPWYPKSLCTYGLISLPYLDGPELEFMKNPTVRFLWLIPITQPEVTFKKKFGMEKLEERFEQAQFNYLNPLRPSVV